MPQSYRAAIAELVGVFLIVFIGGAACASLPADEFGLPLVDPWIRLVAALAQGLAVAVVLPLAFRESPGCLNPALTLTFWVCKRLETRQMLKLIALQLLGGLLAGLAIRGLFPETALRLATPHLGRALYGEQGLITFTSQVCGLVLESLFTFFLTFAVYGLLIDRRAARFGGGAVGLAQAAIVLVGFGLTGGSANPARWLGPAFWQLSVVSLRSQSPLYDNLAYWVGPILGALTAGVVYTTYLLPADQANEAGR